MVFSSTVVPINTFIFLVTCTSLEVLKEGLEIGRGGAEGNKRVKEGEEDAWKEESDRPPVVARCSFSEGPSLH